MAGLGVGVARVVLELGGVHHGVLGRVDAVGDDDASDEEGRHRLQDGRGELLEGGGTEDHLEGIAAVAARGVFGGIVDGWMIRRFQVKLSRRAFFVVHP